MYKSLSYKTKQFFWLIIQLTIVFVCGYFIFNKLNNNENLDFTVFYQNLIKNDVFSFKNLLFLIFLSFLNWFLEIKKWHLLVQSISKSSFFDATKQSLASLTASLITPNRIGEYGAKALFFDKTIRKKIVTLNFVGNIHQLFATLFFGVLGCIYFFWNLDLQIALNMILYSFFGTILSVFLGFVLWKYILKNKNYFHPFAIKISKKTHWKVSVLAFLRFVIFTHQFYFLLFIFKVDISYLDAITAISAMYLCSSVIPMLSLFDVVLKSSIAVIIFSFLQVNSLTILTITTSMWVLNFVVPAIIGSYFVVTFKPKLAL